MRAVFSARPLGAHERSHSDTQMSELAPAGEIFPIAQQENAYGVACPVKILFALSCEQSWTTLEKDPLQAH